MKQCKVLITGPFNAGKTEFVRQASDIEIVDTNRRITDPQAQAVKEETTVAMDYGQVRVGGMLLHLYGTPGQARFEFMWDILSTDMDFFIVVVDSCDRASLMDVKQILRLFRKHKKIPYLIAANKQDGTAPIAPEELRRALSVDEKVPIVPCIARDKKSVHQVLEQVTHLLA